MTVNNPTRRTFLAATAATAWTAQSWARIPGAIDRIRIALIGGAETTQTARARINAATEANNQANFIATTTIGSVGSLRWQDLIESHDIDAIVNAAPILYRGAVTLAAVESGKDVYVMPPIAPLVSEAIAIRDAAQRNGRIVQTGAERIGEPAWREAKDRIEAGALGRVHRASFRFHHNPAAHILESLTDALAPMLYAMPGLPESVAAAGGRRDGDACKPPEMLTLTANYEDDRTLCGSTSTDPQFHAAIRGERDRIVFHNEAEPTANQLMQEWLNAIRNKNPLTSNPDLAIESLTIANAAIESHLQISRIQLRHS